MTNSNQSSTASSPQPNKIAHNLLGAIAGISLVGFIDSAYLLGDHYFNLPLPCSITNGCETVLTSPYAMVGPIPLAFFGVVYYVATMFFALHLFTDKTLVRNQILAFFGLTLVGLLMSVVFMSIQVFLIGAICQYCALSALCTLASFVFATRIERITR